MMTQPDVNIVNNSDAQSSGHQQQTSVTEASSSSQDTVAVPYVNVAISSDNIPTSHSKLDSLPSSENAIGGIYIHMYSNLHL